MKLKQLLFFIGVLLGCNSNENISLSKSSEFALVSPDSNYSPLGIMLYDNGQYISFNKRNLSIYYYDAETYSYHSKAKLDFPLTPENVTFFLPLQDTLIACDTKHKTFYYFNRSGKLIDVWSIFKGKPDSIMPFIPIAKRYYQMQLLDNSLNCRVYPREGFLGECKLPLEYNMTRSGDSTIFKPLPVRYPPVYLKDSYNSLSTENVSRCINDKGQYVYSFPVDHDLYIYDKSGLVLQHAAKSSFINNFEITPPEKYDDLQYTIQSYTTAPYYSKIFFDKFHSLYYRIALHHADSQKEDGTLNYGWRDKPWSILILSEDFLLLKEYKIPASTYYQDILVVPDGILMQPILKVGESQNFSKFIHYKLNLHEGAPSPAVDMLGL